ncbi:hypothetical protein PPYR_03130 [Photinus pyralis]|uniref:Amine oxidase domain-containing protein n=2 Tax=Photinus pyralis TaxID=7054 RepID=A0A5N4A1X1_PHOPY|nr:spermine oxidase-like [Photinus pyralis]KAB0791330.1 hypothetical protein PPYR_03130 [Photinus pyralis]
MLSNTCRLLCFLLLAHANCLENPSVIIIGAGAAGIAAATRLYKHGVRNVTVLEAEGRIGGRIYSVRLGDSYIDLGAQWCHGEQDNVVYSLVKDLKILKRDDQAAELYHSRLEAVDQAFAKSLAEIIDVNGLEDNIQPNLTVGEYLTNIYQKAVLATWQSGSERKLAEECLEVFHMQILAENGAPSWFNISVDDDYEVCSGHQQLSWGTLGYNTIIEVLLRTVPDSRMTDRILLDKEVIAVNCSDISCVVTCSDGTHYTGDHVIFTSSLGVLKSNRVHFTPELPSEKAIAIRSLGFGVVGKIFLYYSNRWWGEGFSGAAFVWDKDEIAKSAEMHPEGPKKGGRSWITGVLEVIPVLGIPNILSVWCVGEFVPEIENASNETIINGVMYLLRTFLRNDYPNVTAPDAILRHNWYSDPHFLGTYSFTTVESRRLRESQRAVLSKPVLSRNGSPALLFAGEATSSTHYATVHGAIDSGFREADRLAMHYRLTA